ncbi:hypothetical protein N656DRAFT_32467 [Canariomyces notabilis]|uniref:Uncharacterized protein n=1 Tax=Canariomyces notabilis TaxID=2074819 RepID=A0AAN6TMV6_9PEZI|nr:hypothetical protein N656DRAFT_32467 [Canariomyces arenarius]
MWQGQAPCRVLVGTRLRDHNCLLSVNPLSWLTLLEVSKASLSKPRPSSRRFPWENSSKWALWALLYMARHFLLLLMCAQWHVVKRGRAATRLGQLHAPRTRHSLSATGPHA